jgi:hypothetical protein
LASSFETALHAGNVSGKSMWDLLRCNIDKEFSKNLQAERLDGTAFAA